MTEAEKFIYNRTAQTFVATGRPKFTVLVKKNKSGADGLFGIGAEKKDKDTDGK